MMKDLQLEDLQGEYDITYQSTPQMDTFFEPGIGTAVISGNKISGSDPLGVEWKADFTIEPNSKLKYQARLDPTKGRADAVLMTKSGTLVREPQDYEGIFTVVRSNSHLILSTRLIQGPLTINVQMMKKS